MSQAALKIRGFNSHIRPRTKQRKWQEVGIFCGAALLAVWFARTVLSQFPAWGVMWVFAITIYFGCKWLSWRNVVPVLKTRSLARSVGYWFAWPGMDAEAFLGDEHKLTKPTWTTWTFALLKTALGVGLIWGVARLAMPYGPLLTAWIGLIGIAFVLHFGLFHLLALAWQSRGVDARPIMDWPILATSLSDFWSHRWNRAFRELAHKVLYHPLCKRLNPQMASGMVFLASGLIHDAVISIPAGAGFGLPTLYFVIQFLGLSIERSSLGRSLGLRHGLTGRLFALLMVAMPVGLLFHGPFIHRVVLPMMTAVHALN